MSKSKNFLDILHFDKLSPKGKKYALQELEDPRRMVTSTVRVENGFLALVPVKTAEPIPKNLIFDVMTQINSVVV